MNQIVGKGSLCFAEAPYIIGTASVVGTKEGEGPLAKEFDAVGADDKFGADNWEMAESNLQKEALTLALGKSRCKKEELRYLFAGDLLGQTTASYFGLKSFQIPMFGLYGACSTCGEALSLAAMTLSAGYAERVGAVTSSHFASAEKQFRFPIQYANQRPMSATWTVTGSGAFILASRNFVEQNRMDVMQKENMKPALAQITGITTGMVVDYGVKDVMNMGAAMAPAAAEVICQHFKDYGRNPCDYDLVITGDLGFVGQTILLEMLKLEGYDLSKVHEDCGIKIFDNQTQGTGSGGSGCGCSAVVLSSYYLKMLSKGELRRILFVPTGALLSPVSAHEQMTIPGIAHAVVLESCTGRKEEVCSM